MDAVFMLIGFISTEAFCDCLERLGEKCKGCHRHHGALVVAVLCHPAACHGVAHLCDHFVEQLIHNLIG